MRRDELPPEDREQLETIFRIVRSIEFMPPHVRRFFFAMLARFPEAIGESPLAETRKSFTRLLVVLGVLAVVLVTAGIVLSLNGVSADPVWPIASAVVGGLVGLIVPRGGGGG